MADPSSVDEPWPHDEASGSEPTALPVYLSSFVGRASELDALNGFGVVDRLITLTGPGGCGKTRLAVELARAPTRTSAGEGVVCFVELAALGPGASVSIAVRSAMNLAEYPGRDPLSTVAAAIAEEPLLLVLDNCEHVVDEAALVADALLQRCPRLRVLATSREPLRVPGERCWRVPALELPPSGVLDPETVVGCDSVTLFLDRAVRVSPGFVLTAENTGALCTLVRQLDGMPLAIELAAAQMGRFGIERISNGLHDRFRLLADGARTASPRQQALETSIAWSYDLLEPSERDVLTRLSVFKGGFTLDAAAETLVGVAALEYAPRVVAQLVDKSLIQIDQNGRYSLLESVRQYGLERLAERDTVMDARHRHLAWASRLAAEAEPELTGPNQARWLDRLELELENLREALAWADACGRIDLVLTMAADLTFFWKLHGHLVEGRGFLDRGLMANVDPEHAALVRAHWSRADLAYWSGDFEDANRDAEFAIGAARRNGDRAIEARATRTLANVESYTRSARDCLPRAEEALELASRSEDLWVRCVATQFLALVCLYSGETSRTAALLVAAQELADVVDSPQLHTWNAAVATTHALHCCDHDLADQFYAAGMRSGLAIADPASTSALRLARSEALLQLGRVAEAAGLLEECLAELEGCGHRQQVPGFAFFLFIATSGEPDGRSDRALEVLERARRISPLWGVLADAARGLQSLNELRTPDASEQLRRAAEAAHEQGNRWVESGLLVPLGLTELADDPGRADGYFHRALELGVECHYPLRVIDALEALGVTSALRGLDPDATRLLGAADAARLERAIPSPAWGSLLTAGTQQLLESRMGDAAFAAAHAEGASMGLEGAAARAQRLRGSRARPAFGWSSLTPAEARVVLLAAEGLTNPQIAAHLFVSRGTVKTHLAHAFAKLGVRNRTELAAALAHHERRATL